MASAGCLFSDLSIVGGQRLIGSGTYRSFDVRSFIGSGYWPHPEGTKFNCAPDFVVVPRPVHIPHVHFNPREPVRDVVEFPAHECFDLLGNIQMSRGPAVAVELKLHDRSSRDVAGFAAALAALPCR
jgi:hypothetical protein